MKSFKILVIAAGLAGLSFGAVAQERGRIISSTPIMERVAIPSQVCSDQMVPVAPRNSGAGGVIGAVAGGLIGNSMGHGGGRAAATAAGLVGGAMLGNSIEAGGQGGYQTVRQCQTRNTYREQAVGYNVVYEVRGRRQSMQSDQYLGNPGSWMDVGYSNNGYSSGYDNGYGYAPAPAPVYQAAPVYPSAPAYQSYQPAPIYAPAPVYSAPVQTYSAPDYVAPMVIGALVGATAYYATRSGRGYYRNDYYRHHSHGYRGGHYRR